MTEQGHPRTIGFSRLVRRFGRLTDDRMAEVDRATQLVLVFLAV